VVAPTEIIVPPRLVRAAGVSVDCDGCSVEIAGDVARITAAVAGEADGLAVITLAY
jgi:hypothetical protein